MSFFAIEAREQGTMLPAILLHPLDRLSPRSRDQLWHGRCYRRMQTARCDRTRRSNNLNGEYYVDPEKVVDQHAERNQESHRNPPSGEQPSGESPSGRASGSPASGGATSGSPTSGSATSGSPTSGSPTS